MIKALFEIYKVLGRIGIKPKRYHWNGWRYRKNGKKPI